MSRPAKNTVDYYPHQCKHKKTISILQHKFGNNGYAFWFKLLELLGDSENHILYLSDDMDWEYLEAYMLLDKEIMLDIINLLVKLKAIDEFAWSYHNAIWCQNFVDNLSSVYQNRKRDLPIFPFNKEDKKRVIDSRNETSNDITTGRNSNTCDITTGQNPQSKVKYSKVNNISSNINITTAPTDEKSVVAKDKKSDKAYFDFDLKIWINITDDKKDIWQRAYPACNIDLQLDKMAAWLLANPNKKKKNYERFITNWLARQQDRGGDIQSNKANNTINWDNVFKGA
jgi:hypothetical protein